MPASDHPIPECEFAPIDNCLENVGKVEILPKLKDWLIHKTPFVLSGPPGCGKRYLLHQALEGRCVAE